MTTTTDSAAFARLSESQRTLYYEATDCGATHADAMEAALTDGYTAPLGARVPGGVPKRRAAEAHAKAMGWGDGSDGTHYVVAASYYEHDTPAACKWCCEHEAALAADEPCPAIGCALVEALLGVPLVHCHVHGWVTVDSFYRGPGMCTPMSVTTYSCGCSDVYGDGIES